MQRGSEPVVEAVRQRIVARRGREGKQLAKVAAARKLAHIVYYTLRDGQARCLTA